MLKQTAYLEKRYIPYFLLMGYDTPDRHDICSHCQCIKKRRRCGILRKCKKFCDYAEIFRDQRSRLSLQISPLTLDQTYDPLFCIRQGLPKKVSVLLDFVQMRGGGPCPNLLSTFHKLYTLGQFGDGEGGGDPCPNFLAHWC